MQGRGLHQVGPAQQRGEVRHGFQAQPTELAQHQAVAHEVLGLGIRPLVQVLNDQQPQDDLDRGRWPPGLGRVRSTPRQIGPELVEELVVLEQSIQFGQFRLEAQFECRHEREQVDRRVSVA